MTTTTTTKKITKKEKLNAIYNILAAAEDVGIVLDSDEITYDMLREFCTNEVDLLDAKAVAAANRAAAKKAEGDALREKIYNTLSTTDFMFISDITKAVNEPDVTDAKVIARLKQLADMGKVEKEMKSAAATEGGKARELSAYRRLV